MLPEEIFYNEHVPVDIILLGVLLLETVRKTIWTVIRIEREKVDNKDKFRKFDFRKKF
jgi:3-hydroxymyristoyl/3-hydroxydecanoyl-(acyl carrier protein) dehydratase